VLGEERDAGLVEAIEATTDFLKTGSE